MVAVGAAFFMALAWSALAPRLGPRLGLVDTPGEDALKVHERPIPLLGGIGIFVALHLGLLVAGSFDGGLFAATLFLLVLGLIDDRSGLSPRVRLGAELIAALVLIAASDLGLGLVGYIVGVPLVVVAINAVNLLDGLDGLVGSVTLVGGLGLAWLGADSLGDSELGLVLAAATAGFLVLNWNPARLFLGDNGAYVIGLVLAYGVLAAVSRPDGGLDVATGALATVGVLGVFLVDLVATITRRGLSGKPLFAGDRGHIYDQLRDRGRSVRSVALTAGAAQTVFVAAFVLPAIGGVGLPTAFGMIGGAAAVLFGLLWGGGFLTVGEAG